MATPLLTDSWDGLRAELHGNLRRPADPEYTFAKELQNRYFDAINPQGIAYCETVDDVRACIRFAQDNGIAAHVRSGGHSMSGWSTGPGLVIDMSRINEVAVEGSVVRIGSGTRSLDAMNALAARNTQIVTGTFPTVSAGGFLSGGGIGWQTRKFGIASDRIAAARVVLADGRLVRCSATEEPDLYWAVRGGGGGNFGIVVDFEVVPIDAPLLVGYETIWRIDHAPQVLKAWQEWCVEGPDDLGSSLVVLPPFGPDGTPIVKIWGILHAGRSEMDGLLDRLAELAGIEPVARTVGDPRPFSEVMHECLCGELSVDECQRTGHSPVAKGHRHPFTVQAYHLTDRAVTADEAERLFAAWDPSITWERYLLCIAVGGAANRVSETETAYVHRNAQFLVGYQFASRAENAAQEHRVQMTEWVDRADAALSPLSCGSYINFPSTRVAENWGEATYGQNYARLRTVKKQYDPNGFFQHGQSI